MIGGNILSKDFIETNSELVYNFKNGRRNHSCVIKVLSNEFLDVDCTKCHTLCGHVLDLAQNYISHPISIKLFETLWFYNKVSRKTLLKAIDAIKKTKVNIAEPNCLSAIVDGNNETYTILFEDKKRYCSCIYGKSNKGMCYHQVATVISAILEKRLNTSEVKELIE